MSWLTKGGISKLSELEIDADKDWSVKGISNILEVVLGMQVGDIAYKGPLILEKLSPGAANLVLTSEGSGHIPVWAPGGTYFFRYLPVSVDAEMVAEVVTPDHSIDKEALVESSHTETTVPTRTPAMTSDMEAAVVTPDHPFNLDAPIASDFDYGVA